MKLSKTKAVILGAVVALTGVGIIGNGAVSAKSSSSGTQTKTMYVGKAKRSGYNYSQCKSWISGWNSCKYGCGWVTIAAARSYTRGAATPKSLWKNVSTSKLNSGMGDSAFKTYAKKAGLSVSSVGKDAKSIATALYNGKVLGIHLSGHWILAYGANVKITKSGNKYTYSLVSVCISDPGNSSRRGKCVSPSSIKAKKIFGLK